MLFELINDTAILMHEPNAKSARGCSLRAQKLDFSDGHVAAGRDGALCYDIFGCSHQFRQFSPARNRAAVRISSYMSWRLPILSVFS